MVEGWARGGKYWSLALYIPLAQSSSTPGLFAVSVGSGHPNGTRMSRIGGFFCKFANNCRILLKLRYDDPYVIVAGDFNRRDFKSTDREFPEIKPILTGPTQGQTVLDIVGTSFNPLLLEAAVIDPIMINDPNLGADADHSIVCTKFRRARVPQYKVESYSYCRLTEDRNAKLAEYLDEQAEWHDVSSSAMVSHMVEELQRIFKRCMDSSFKYVTQNKKNSEPV